jgi:hypothetical protein
MPPEACLQTKFIIRLQFICLHAVICSRFRAASATEFERPPDEDNPVEPIRICTGR